MKKFLVKNVIYNHVIKNGEKELSEKIFYKTSKNLQKQLKKSSKYLITSALFLSLPAFKILKFRKKRRKKIYIREVPFFLQTKKEQISLAVKLILKSFYKKNSIAEILKNEFILISKNVSDVLKLKDKLHDSAIKKKYIFRRYKW